MVCQSGAVGRWVDLNRIAPVVEANWDQLVGAWDEYFND